MDDLTRRLNKLKKDNYTGTVTLSFYKGSISKKIIEIKPKKQTVPPKKPKKKRSKRFLTESKTYVTNCSKWEAAKKYCQKRKWIFQILTEDHLYK